MKWKYVLLELKSVVILILVILVVATLLGQFREQQGKNSVAYNITSIGLTAVESMLNQRPSIKIALIIIAVVIGFISMIYLRRNAAGV